MIKDLVMWEVKTHLLAEYFVKRYFGKPDDVEHWWVADDIGGVLSVADYFFSLSDIVAFIKYKYTRKQLFEYYEYRTDLGMKKKPELPICIRDWKKLK